MADSPTTPDQFHRLFQRWRERIGKRLTTRGALTGLAWGLGLSLLTATVAWRLRVPTLQHAAWSLGALGLVIGGAVAWRRRWNDTETALYLDGVWRTDEAITTAVSLTRGRDVEWPNAPLETVLEAAREAISQGNPKLARPKMVRRYHLAAPILAGALVWLTTLPPPPLPPAPPPPPGQEQVRIANLEALEKVIALEKLRTPDPEQKKRLEKIAQRARELRAKLKQGMEKRKAQSELAQLRDDVAAERARFGTGKQRAGLEAARGALAKNRLLRKAAKALGDRDLTNFDKEMRKLANTLEREDREKAKQALKEAEEAAKRRNAPGVAKMLAEQRKLFAERSKRGEALREFAKSFGKALPPEARKQLDRMQAGSPDPSASSKLSKRMAEALSKLTPEERKRLAERLRKQALNDQLSPSTRRDLRDMAKKLDTPEGRRQLEKMLKQMAEAPKSGAAERDKALGEAEKGLGQAQRGLGAPVPIPGPSGGSPGPTGPQGRENSKQAPPGPGSHHDKGAGKHDGNTPKVGKDDFRARVGGKINAGAPMPGTVIGRGRGAPGETANMQGMGAIGKAAPKEMSGVERSEIPEEYREQVGRYFSP